MFNVPCHGSRWYSFLFHWLGVFGFPLTFTTFWFYLVLLVLQETSVSVTFTTFWFYLVLLVLQETSVSVTFTTFWFYLVLLVLQETSVSVTFTTFWFYLVLLVLQETSVSVTFTTFWFYLVLWVLQETIVSTCICWWILDCWSNIQTKVYLTVKLGLLCGFVWLQQLKLAIELQLQLEYWFVVTHSR